MKKKVSISLIILFKLNRPTATIIHESDREAIRTKILSALRKRVVSYDEMLELCSSFAEECVYSTAPSKLDYYKKSILCVKRIFDRNTEPTKHVEGDEEYCDEAGRVMKRAKTHH